VRKKVGICLRSISLRDLWSRNLAFTKMEVIRQKKQRRKRKKSSRRRRRRRKR